MENSETKELDIQTLYCLLDHCRLGIIIADAKGMILWGNDYYSAMAGFNIKDFIGQDIRIISRRNLVTLSGPVMADQVLETGEELTDIVTYPNEDFIATTLTPVRDSRGEIRYLIYSVTNCSESIRMQTGWIKDADGTWYYLNQSGAMLSNTIVDGYVLNKDGAWVK